MKKALYIFGSLVLAAMLFATACSDEGSEIGVPLLELESSDVLFSYSGGTGTIVVIADGPVKAETKSDWCSVQSVNGRTVTLSAAKNPGVIGRAARITVEADGKKVNVIASQIGETFSVSPKLLEFPGRTDTKTVIVDSDYDLTVEPSADWLSYSWSADKKFLYVTAAANPDFSGRDAKIVFTNPGGITKSINVVQDIKVMEYEEFLGDWRMTYYNASSTESESEVTISAKTNGRNYTLSGLSYDMTLNYVDGRIEFYVNQVVGTYTTGGVGYDIYIRMVNDSSTSNNTAGAGMYSTPELVDGRIELTLHNNGVYADGTGFGFYATVNGSNTYFAKYRTLVKLYKLD